MPAAFDLIAFDGDDTLWHNERSYRAGRQRFQQVLAQSGVTLSEDPAHFLMIGNLLRSDVLPVIAAGGWAVHVPAALTWAHEHAAAPELGHDRFFELPALGAVCRLIATLEQKDLLRDS